MKIIKTLVNSLIYIFQSMAANSNSYVRGLYMLNQLGYAAGTEDGIKGKNTIKALTKYYADNNKVFDGTIDDNELIELKTSVISLGIPKIEETKNKLKVHFFGNFISNQSKIIPSNSPYFLPSDLFQRKNASENRENILHKSYGINNDGRQDLLS